MRFLLSLFLFVCLTHLNAQLHVQVKDADTKQPLPFATAECMPKQWGKYSDSLGKISIPDSIWKNNSVAFSYVGYKALTKKITPTNSEVLLERLPNENLVLVKSCKTMKDATIKNYKKKPGGSTGWAASGEGFIWAGFVANTTGKQGLINSISFFVKTFHPKAINNAPVRLRLYEYDMETGLPGVEITNESIMITPKKFGMHTEDLASYKIIIPQQGLVAGFEMFDAGNQYHYIYHMKFTDGTEKDVEMYGWSLGAFSSEKTLGFKRHLGGIWLKTNRINSDKNHAPAITLNLSICK